MVKEAVPAKLSFGIMTTKKTFSPDAGDIGPRVIELCIEHDM